jgi:GNAT superfamily N-acetyltransferase
MSGQIKLAKKEQEILDCYPVMSELRPHIKPYEFLSRVQRLAEIADYQLAYLVDGEVKAVAGFRISDWLAGGKHLEIEDLIATVGERSKGYGGKLFDWLVKYAEDNEYRQLRLVSSVSRFDAHRFYLSKRMIIEAYYFSMNLK